MILQQVIRCDNAAALEATWTDADGNVARCHTYDATQMDELRADLGADAQAYAPLIRQCLADYVPPTPEAPLVPAYVTMRQARLALLAADLLDGVDAAIQAIPDAMQRRAAKIEWEYASTVERDGPFTQQLAAGLGLDGPALDNLFTLAGGL
jgi:hypothetical protein